MMHNTRLLAVAAGLVFLAAVSPALPVAAQQNATKSALAVSPAIMEEVLTPGKKVAFTLSVQNVTRFPLPIKSFVQNLTVQSAELEKTDRDRLDASRWFTLDEPDFILQPDQVRIVKGVIAPPANATPGGHYATVYFQPLVPAEALSASMAYINAKVGVLAFLVVKGDIEQKAALGAPLHTKGLIRKGPAEFSFSIHNSGNVHLLPSGKLAIYDWRGRRTASLALPSGIVLPDATKEYRMQWNPPGIAGKYRAELTLEYGAEHTALPKTIVSFWILPWAETITGVLLLTGIVLLVRRIRRRWRKAWRAFHH